MILLSAAPFLLSLAAAASAPGPALAPASVLARSTESTLTLPATITVQATAKEGESGHRYPVTIDSTLTAADAKKEGAKPVKMDLLGMGIREKTIFNVNVYSYALFVDQKTIQEDLGRWKGASAKKVGKDSALFAKLLTQSGTKELRLRFCRKVDTEDVVSAFEDSLKPRILAMKKSESATELKKLENLNRFRKFFKADKLKDGHELRFTWQPDGTLSTVVNGERREDILAPALCKALFDVYIGAKPISKSSKKKLVKRLPELLK
ncbi:MAG: hypothetical protein ACJA0P_003844 [Planctomycetota bacterium]|jgi:hypothetical protein